MIETDTVCSHGYVKATAGCPDCYAQGARAAGPDELGEQFERFMAQHKDGKRAGWLTRRTAIQGELAKLDSYSRRSNAQDDDMQNLISEMTVLGSLIDEDDVRVRSETISRGLELMKDPANREGPEPAVGAPALVKGLGDRRESPGETLQRMRSNPWRHEDGPVNRADTLAGLIARCHTALEGLEPQLTRDGCQKVAEAFAEQTSWPGITIQRSKNEQAEAAELFLALSDPHYSGCDPHERRQREPVPPARPDGAVDDERRPVRHLGGQHRELAG